MLNAECRRKESALRMNEIRAEGTPSLCTLHFALCISRFGEGVKIIPSPETIRGGIQSLQYSTVPPWLQRTALPLIDALTGAPGRPFPTCSSEVVWYIGRGAEPSQQTGSSLGFFPGTGSSSRLFHMERIYHIFSGKSIPTQGKNTLPERRPLHCRNRRGKHKKVYIIITF